MAYEDWMPEFQEIWEQMPVSELDDQDYALAEFMFEEGFMTYAGEAPPEDIKFAREQFWDIMGEYWEDHFDWDAWREAMYPEQ